MVIGMMINSMEMVQKNEWIIQFIRDNFITDKNMGKANLYGQMAPCMRGSLKIIIFQVKAYINGLMNVNTLDSGKRIKWKDMAFLLEKMAENLKDSM